MKNVKEKRDNAEKLVQMLEKELTGNETEQEMKVRAPLEPPSSVKPNIVDFQVMKYPRYFDWIAIEMINAANDGRDVTVDEVLDAQSICGALRTNEGEGTRTSHIQMILHQYLKNHGMSCAKELPFQYSEESNAKAFADYTFFCKTARELNLWDDLVGLGEHKISQNNWNDKNYRPGEIQLYASILQVATQHLRIPWLRLIAVDIVDNMISLQLTVFKYSKLGIIDVVKVNGNNPNDVIKFLRGLVKGIELVGKHRVVEKDFCSLPIYKKDFPKEIVSFRANKTDERIFYVKSTNRVIKLFDLDLHPECQLNIKLVEQMLPGVEFKPLLIVNGEEKVWELSYNFIKLANKITIEHLISLCVKLKAIHDENYVHGDIRNANIIFGEANESYIIDFDFARKVDKSQWYFETYNGNLDERHQEAKPWRKMDKSHDIFSLKKVIKKHLGTILKDDNVGNILDDKSLEDMIVALKDMIVPLEDIPVNSLMNLNLNK